MYMAQCVFLCAHAPMRVSWAAFTSLRVVYTCMIHKSLKLSSLFIKWNGLQKSNISSLIDGGDSLLLVRYLGVRVACVCIRLWVCSHVLMSVPRYCTHTCRSVFADNTHDASNSVVIRGKDVTIEDCTFLHNRGHNSVLAVDEIRMASCHAMYVAVCTRVTTCLWSDILPGGCMLPRSSSSFVCEHV